MDVQPPHHRQIAFLGEVCHGRDPRVLRIVVDMIVAFDILNIVGIESNILFIGSTHPSLVNLGVPHLIPSGLVILDRPAGVSPAPLEVRVGGPSCGGGHRPCSSSPTTSHLPLTLVMVGMVRWFEWSNATCMLAAAARAGRATMARQYYVTEIEGNLRFARSGSQLEAASDDCD